MTPPNKAAIAVTIIFIHQYTHQFRHRQRGMSIIQLDCNFVRELMYFVIRHPSHDIMQGACDQKVFLDQS